MCSFMSAKSFIRRSCRYYGSSQCYAYEQEGRRRTFAVVLLQAGKAASAALIASSVSFAPISGTVANSSNVAGSATQSTPALLPVPFHHSLVTEIVCPSCASSHLPLIKPCVFTSDGSFNPN